MGTTSEKLTYLNTTKTLIKEELNLGGANISNEPFRVYSSKLIDIYKDFLANGTDVVWNNWLPKVTGSGETLTLNNTIEAKMDFVYKGNTYQYSTIGKNIFNQNTISSMTGESATYSDGVITVAEHTLTGATNVVANFPTVTLTPNTYYLSMDIRIKSGTGNFSKINDGTNGWTEVTKPALSNIYQRYVYKCTYSSNFNFDRLLVQFTNSTNASYEITNMMLSTSNNTTYEPYTNGASPNPDYPQDIQVVSGDNTIKVEGKNLFNAQIQAGTYNQATYTVASDGLITQSASDDSGWGASNRMFTLEAGTYTISIIGKDNSSMLQVRNITDNSDVIQTQNNSETFTLTSKKKVALKTWGGSHYPLSYYIQIEKGNQVTSYQAYQTPQTYPISLDYTNLFKKQDISSDDLNRRLNQIGIYYNEIGYFISPFIKVDEGTQYTINYTPTAYTRICYYASNNTNSFISKNDDTSSFTTPSTCQYLRFCNLIADIDNIRLEKGSTITNNYIELCKIGTYQDKIAKSTGKNLFDVSTITENTYIDENGNTGTSSVTNLSDYIEVKSNTSYTLSYDYSTLLNSNQRNVCYYNENKTFISSDVYIPTDKTHAITTPNNAKYIRISYDKNCYSIMTNKGTTALPYEPYGKVWYLNKQIGKVVLDGSESSWGLNSIKDITQVFHLMNGIVDKSLTNNNFYSNYFIIQAGDTEKISFYQTQLYIAINKERASTLGEFKTWLSTHNTTVYYVLATPTYEEITDTTLISQLEAIKKSYNTQTNISQTNTDKPFILDVVALGELEI